MFATGNTTTTTGNMSQQTGGSLNVGANQQQEGHLMMNNNNRNSNASLGMISSTTSYFDLDTNVEKTIATKTMAPYVLQGKELIEAGIDDTNCLINVPFSIPYMEVFIDKCQDLPTKLNSSGLCDPYIVLSVIQLGDSELRDFSQIPSNEEICKSSKIKKNNNPTWNGKERFLMSVPPQVFSSTSSSLGAMTMSGVSIQNSSSQSFTIGSKKTGVSFKDKKSKSNDNIIPTVSKSSENIGFKNQYLLIQVYSYDRLKKDSFIGSARIGPLSRLPYGVMLSKTVPLHESGSGATCTVRFIAHNFGLSWEEFEDMDASENDFLTFKPVCADPVKAVLDKITGSRYAGQFPNPKDEVRFATMLANKKHLMETYLNKDWVEVIPTQKRSIPKQQDLPEKDKKTPTSFSPSNEILPSNSVTTSPSPTHSSVVAVDSPRLFNVNPTPPQQQENQLNTTESPNIKESQSEDSINNQVEDTNTNNSSNSSEHEEEEQEANTEETVSDEEDEDDEEEEAEHESKEMQEFIQEQEKQLLKGKVDIKLIIVDQERDQKFKSSARKFLSPILSKIGSTKNLSSFGMFHSSLLIGNWILEWNDSALCVPRRTLSKAALFCADLEPITTLEDLNEVVDKIADVIVEWNTTKKYKPMGGNRCVYGNCQDFVEAVLSRLGIKWQIENPYIRYFFEQLKKKGSTDLKLFFKKEDADQENSFVQKFKLLSQSGSTSGQGTYSIKFATHEQLDQFVLRCLRIDPMMKTNYPEVWGILKGFDRAFWLRHLAWEEMKERKRRELVSIERNLFKISQLRRANRLTEEDKAKESKLFERASEIQKEVDRIEKEGKPVKPFMGKQLDERKELVEVDLCPFSNPLTTYSIRLYN